MPRTTSEILLHRRPMGQLVALLLLVLMLGAAHRGPQGAALGPGPHEDVIGIAPTGGGATPREERPQLAPDAPLLAASGSLALRDPWSFCAREGAQRAALLRGFPDRIDRPPPSPSYS